MSRSSTPRKNNTAWLGGLPFPAFCLVFEIIPVLILLRGSFCDKDGALTRLNYQKASAPLYIPSFWRSIQLSVVTAILRTILGLLVGYAICQWPSQWVREALTGLADVTKFAGAPPVRDYVSFCVPFLRVIRCPLDSYRG